MAKRSRKLRLALSGCGGMSRSHTRALRDVPQAELVALMDIVPQATEKLAAEVASEGAPKPQLFTDFERMAAQRAATPSVPPSSADPTR